MHHKIRWRSPSKPPIVKAQKLVFTHGGFAVAVWDSKEQQWFNDKNEPLEGLFSVLAWADLPSLPRI